MFLCNEVPSYSDNVTKGGCSRENVNVNVFFDDVKEEDRRGGSRLTVNRLLGGNTDRDLTHYREKDT